MPTAKPRRLLEKKHSIDEKNMDSKSLDSVGGFITDGDSIGTSDDHDGPLSSTIKDDGFETESSQAHSELPLPDIEGLKRELTIKLARPVPIRARREDLSPQTPAAIATSIRLMGIWHAYHILEQIKSGDRVNIIDLRKIVRLASAHSGEKNPETILRELERREGTTKNFGYVDLKDMLVSHYR